MDSRSDEPAKREIISSITSTAGNVYRGEEGDVEDNGLSINDMPPTPDTVPITTSTAMQETCDEIDAGGTVQIESTEKSNNGLRTKTELVKRCGATEVAASFNT